MYVRARRVRPRAPDVRALARAARSRRCSSSRPRSSRVGTPGRRRDHGAGLRTRRGAGSHRPRRAAGLLALDARRRDVFAGGDRLREVAVSTCTGARASCRTPRSGRCTRLAALDGRPVPEDLRRARRRPPLPRCPRGGRAWRSPGAGSTSGPGGARPARTAGHRLHGAVRCLPQRRDDGALRGRGRRCSSRRSSRSGPSRDQVATYGTVWSMGSTAYFVGSGLLALGRVEEGVRCSSRRWSTTGQPGASRGSGWSAPPARRGAG